MTIFQLIEFENNTEVSTRYSYNLEDNISIEASELTPKHNEVIQSKPSGNYSEISSFHAYSMFDTVKIVNRANRDKEGLESIKTFLSNRQPTKTYYYQNLSDRPKIQHSLGTKTLFSNNIYIGRILNDTFYLTSDQFETKYARLGKKVENITKAFENPSIKYTVKSGFLTGDQEVMIYQKGSSLGDIHLTHMAKDHIHLKELLDSMHGEMPFWVTKNERLEKIYQVFGTSPSNQIFNFPPNLNHANITFNMAGKLAVIGFGYFFKNSPWLVE